MRSAFTLVELLVSVAILAVLAAIALPTGRLVMAKSRSASCIGNLRSIGVAIEGYLQDHNQIMPDLEAGRRWLDEEVPVLDTELADYLPDPGVFRCPADKTEFTASGCSYLWNQTQSGRHRLKLSFLGAEGTPESVPLVFDKEAWHPGDEGVNILYADYHLSNRVEFRTSP